VTLPLWSFLVVAASALQVLRNASQRALTDELGVWGAAYVRFVYGLPFALIWAGAIIAQRGLDGGANAAFLGWTLFGSVMQGVATVFLVTAMQGRNFAVATALAKTEVLGATAIGALLTHDVITGAQWGGAIVASLGIALLARVSVTPAALRAAFAGAAAGACFSFSAVSYRAAALAWGGDLWSAAAMTLVSTLAAQTLLGALTLALVQPAALAGVARAWKPSLVPGAAGAFSSALLFTAFALGPSAGAVKTIQLTDVFIAWLVSRRVFREGLTRAEWLGGGLILAGAALVLAGA
jgi:drug/metabolite transporter (DMT)-like permease